MIHDDVKYTGVFDSALDLFEGQYKIPNGISYNSYVVIDEQIAVFDSVDRAFTAEWLKNIEVATGGKQPDYLIVQHMEPDHSASIFDFAKAYPEAKIVSSAKAFGMMNAFFGTDFASRRIVVKDGDNLQIGKHKFTFIAAPMVHWPEVMLTYESTDKLLFSADAFGRFGSTDPDAPWADEARRYYIGIVGKYGAQVQALLKKTGGLDVRAILPLHGPVLSENIPYYIGLYDTWSSYNPEAQGVMIACASIYGNTLSAARLLRDRLTERGVEAKLFDLTRCDISEAIANAFKYDRLVLASVTYNGDVFPPMRAFIHGLTERNFKARRVSFIENGSWAPMAAKVMRGMLEGCSELQASECSVKILSAMSGDTAAAIDSLAEELAK